MQQVPLGYSVVASSVSARKPPRLHGEVSFASPEEQEQRGNELLGDGALLVRLPPPTSHVRGHLGSLLEELVERELARAGAPSPYLAAWTAMPDEANSRLADQLSRAEAVGASGLAIALGTLGAIARPTLCPDDSALLRWLAEATTALPLVLLIDDGDMLLTGYAAPRSLVDLLVQTRHDSEPPVMLTGDDATVIESSVVAVASAADAANLAPIAGIPTPVPSIDFIEAIITSTPEPISVEIAVVAPVAPEDMTPEPATVMQGSAAVTIRMHDEALAALAAGHGQGHEFAATRARSPADAAATRSTTDDTAHSASDAAATRSTTDHTAHSASDAAAARSTHDHAVHSASDAASARANAAAIADSTIAAAAVVAGEQALDNRSGNACGSVGEAEPSTVDETRRAELVENPSETGDDATRRAQAVDSPSTNGDDATRREGTVDITSTDRDDATRRVEAVESADADDAMSRAKTVRRPRRIGGFSDAAHRLALETTLASVVGASRGEHTVHNASANADDALHGAKTADTVSKTGDDAPRDEEAVHNVSVNGDDVAPHGAGPAVVAPRYDDDAAATDAAAGAAAMDAAGGAASRTILGVAPPANEPRTRRMRTARSAVAGAVEAGPNDAWRGWALTLSAARGAQPLAAFEKLFADSYVPLANAIAGGLDDPRAMRAFDEFRRAFERSYTDAFATFGATNRRPRLVMDAFEIANKQARLVNARSAHILVVDSMRFDLGVLVRDALAREIGGVASLSAETILWSALPTTTIRQLETLARGMDALRAPAREEASESLRGRAAEVVRRCRVGSREIHKLDLVPALVEAAGVNAIAELPTIAQSVAEAIARHVTTLAPRTLVFIVGDHGFSVDRRGQIQSGGATPEEVLVPAQSWLLAELH